MRRLTAPFVAIALVAAAPAAPTASYHGFRFNVADEVSPAERESLLAAARGQVDIVEGVGLTADTLAFLRGYPIHLSSGPGGGHFGRDGVFVNLPPRADDRPILLHELMHAYQSGRLAGGIANADMRRFFAEARTPGLWPVGSYMLSNIGEFFAMTTSVALYGHAARPPFTRAALAAKQPAYLLWIQANVR